MDKKRIRVKGIRKLSKSSMLLSGYPSRELEQWFTDVNIELPHYEIILYEAKYHEDPYHPSDNDFDYGVEVIFKFVDGLRITVHPIDPCSEYWEIEYDQKLLEKFLDVQDKKLHKEFDEYIITYGQELISLYASENYSFCKNIECCCRGNISLDL